MSRILHPGRGDGNQHPSLRQPGRGCSTKPAWPPCPAAPGLVHLAHRRLAIGVADHEPCRHDVPSAADFALSL